MKANDAILKNRMKLKRLEIKAQIACDDNFGYSPDCPWFDQLLNELNKVRTEVQQQDKEWFKNVYEPTEYKDSLTCWKKMPIF
jgi:hypothetical protein